MTDVDPADAAVILDEIDAEDFLEIVWGDRPGFIDLPAKVGRYWVPWHYNWPVDTVITRRIDSSLRDREDLYYSVATFRKKGRRIEDVQPTWWLWADLDEVHPTEAARLGLMPTFAIQSSPGRYQALWRLSRRLRPKDTEKLNRGLTYALGADRGGWDLTQVLRLPGTRNYKYPEAPVVTLMWYKPSLVYSPEVVWRAVKDTVDASELEGIVGVDLPRKPIPRKAKQLLFATSDMVVEGERSARLWELNCLLAEAGLSAEEILTLVVKTPWNKWAGMGTGRDRLTRDIHKAIQHVARKHKAKEADARKKKKGKDAPEDDEKALPWVSYRSFLSMTMEEPKWMVDRVWTAGSHGIIGGEPKTSKTTLALALGLSVASGKDFLGRYAVGTSGPVLFAQEENAPWMMQDRMRRLSRLYGIGDLEDVPLKILNNWGFNLAIEEHRDMLEAEIALFRPIFVILDPLYLMFGGADESRSSDLSPFLRWLIRIRFEYNTAVAVVHHMGKQKTGSSSGGYTRAGQRLLGSTTLHGFSDSALYTTKLDDDRQGWTKCRIEPEFRSMEPQPGFAMSWHFHSKQGVGMDLEVTDNSLESLIRDLVTREGGEMRTSDLVDQLGVSQREIAARIRGGELGMTYTHGKPGRGNASRVSLNGSR